VVYGLAHLTKQNLMGFEPVHYLIISRGMPLRRRVMGGFFVAVLTVLLLFPWAMRNRVVLGRWVLETKSGFNLCLMNNINWSKSILAEDFVGAPPSMPSWVGLSEVERDAACKRVFFTFLREHPAKFCELCVSRFVIAFRPTPISLQLPRVISWPYGVANCCIYLLAIVGMAWSLQRRVLLDATALVIYTAVVTALTNASFRHRSYADPFLLLLAVVGVMAVRKTMETRRARPAVVPVGAVG
jgi:hypothetical protein